MSLAQPSEFEPFRAPRTRRDMLYLSTAAVCGVGAAATLIPLISQMNPDAAAVAAGAPIDVDLSKVAPGAQLTVKWRDNPVFIVNRTPALLKTLDDKAVVGDLSDPDSTATQQPAYARNWHRSIRPEIGVYVGICTHLGCIPQFEPRPSATTPAPNWPGGYFCPCHGSKYDLAGRVFRGVPAPYNLPVPPCRFLDDTHLRVGENPAGSTFDLDSIQQL